MRILAISDEPSPRLWGELARDALQGVDLILSAGDLPGRYLSFLTCFTTAPIVYVHGNHDDRYAKDPPEGCLCADGNVVRNGNGADNRRTRPDKHVITDHRRLLLSVGRPDGNALLNAAVFTDAGGRVNDNRPPVSNGKSFPKGVGRNVKTAQFSPELAQTVMIPQRNRFAKR